MERMTAPATPEFGVFAELRRTVACAATDRASENVDEGDTRPANAHVRGTDSGGDGEGSRPCFRIKTNVVFAESSPHSGRRSREDEGYEQPV